MPDEGAKLTYTQAEVAALLATHAALPSVHHTKYTDAEALAAAIAGGLSKVVWKDTSEQALYDVDRTVTLDWTDLDLTAYTSANAKFAIILISFSKSVKGTGDSYIQIRKNGTTPTWAPSVQISAVVLAYDYRDLNCILALDSGQVLEYKIGIGAGVTASSSIVVLGYIE